MSDNGGFVAPGAVRRHLDELEQRLDRSERWIHALEELHESLTGLRKASAEVEQGVEELQQV